MKTLINVSNRLPVTIDETIKKSAGGLVTAMEGLEKKFDFKWIGWAGGTVSDTAAQHKILEELRQRFNFIPIFLSKEEAANYYTGFSNSSLWPLLHYLPDYARYEERWYEFYRKVNCIFADTIEKEAPKNADVWIQDYHLMLLPGIIRERRPDLKIGFFLHTPFPSYEIFRCHPNREELLEGLLGADLIGFHTFGYLRHFRSTVLRILGRESEMNAIPSETHSSTIGVYPIGINTEKFLKELNSNNFIKFFEGYREVFKSRKIALSVERLDYTKGIPRRLDAIERFLKMTKRKDIVFIFISVPSREAVLEYQALRRNVQRKISKINGKYSTIENVPVHFIHKSVSFSELCALYSLADVAIVTPLVDGMNLVAKEYLFCQQEKNGVLILSEFTGAAQELSNAFIVNPYNLNEVAESLKDALACSEGEKKKMNAPMKARVTEYNAEKWANSFLRDLTAARLAQKRSVDTRELSLDDLSLLPSAKNVAFFLDYDGTLAELKKRPADALPDEDIKALFSALQKRSYLDVYLISGRKCEDMDQWFSKYELNLIAEHGYYYKHRNASKWVVFDTKADLSWKKQIIHIFQHYAGMTPGSFMEEKTSSVVWHYRQADPEFGSWKAHQLVSELFEMLSNLPVEIHHGRKIVEVGSIHINKGIVMEHFMLLNKYDAVLCAGDDETDESMFRITDDRILSVKVGEGNGTAAKYKISGPKAFRTFLSGMLEKFFPPKTDT
jgi:trehalose 6-phosphate synthase/phosphatase